MKGLNALKIIPFVTVPIGAYRGYTQNVPETSTYTEHVVSRLIHTVGGIGINTFLFPVCFYNTARRIEVHVRDLEAEKTKRWYNDLI